MLTRGGPFDAAFQEAVDRVEHEGPENQVVWEELAGYLEKGKVLRYSRVVLSRPITVRGSPTVPEPSPQEERPAPEPPAAPLSGPVEAVWASPVESSSPVQGSRDQRPGGSPSFLARLWDRIAGNE
jgi:hypothetical protein